MTDDDEWEYLNRLPKAVPEGKFLVHNRVRPARHLNHHGFRAWLTAQPDDIYVCDCGWAAELGDHYRMLPDEVLDG